MKNVSRDFVSYEIDGGAISRIKLYRFIQEFSVVDVLERLAEFDDGPRPQLEQVLGDLVGDRRPYGGTIGGICVATGPGG
jgi:hypothetical protein